jgi:hypothetical protein
MINNQLVAKVSVELQNGSGDGAKSIQDLPAPLPVHPSTVS